MAYWNSKIEEVRQKSENLRAENFAQVCELDKENLHLYDLLFQAGKHTRDDTCLCEDMTRQVVLESSASLEKIVKAAKASHIRRDLERILIENPEEIEQLVLVTPLRSIDDEYKEKPWTILGARGTLALDSNIWFTPFRQGPLFCFPTRLASMGFLGETEGYSPLGEMLRFEEKPDPRVTETCAAIYASGKLTLLDSWLGAKEIER